MPQRKLKSEKGAFALKTFQFEFAKRTHGNEFSQFGVRRFAQRATLVCIEREHAFDAGFERVSVDEIGGRKLLLAGADKVSINTAVMPEVTGNKTP